MADVIANTEQETYGGFSSMLASIRGIDQFAEFGGGNVVCDPSGACFDQPMPCPPGVPCGPMGGGGAFPGPVPAPDDEPVAGHFWPRFAASIGVLALLLTFFSMRLVSPAALRGWRRRRRPAPVTA